MYSRLRFDSRKKCSPTTQPPHNFTPMPAQRPKASTPSRSQGTKKSGAGVSKRNAPSSVFDRVGSGLRAFRSNAMTGLGSKMRAFGSNVGGHRRRSQGGDLRARATDRHARAVGINARLGDARGSEQERWPRGQIVGVEDDLLSGDLRRRISSGSKAAATTNKKVDDKDRDLRGVVSSGRKGASDKHRKCDRGVHQLLRRLQLEKFAPMFAKEEIDMHSLRAMRDKDYHALKIPMGPRLKIQEAIRR